MPRIKGCTPSDVYDVDKNTGALILGKNRLDDYAQKFLTQFCPEALSTPMPLPVEDMLKKAGLVVEQVALSKDLDIFGCCIFLDGNVNIYDTGKDEYIQKPYRAGTILVDPGSAWAYGEGSRRNTLIHEMLHWEKDKRYFEILALRNQNSQNPLLPIMCRQSRTDYEPARGKRTKQNELQWLEWQAHKLAPRVLMPKEMFKKKAAEFLDSGLQSCDELVHQLSEFFEVSRFSVKLRLWEVELTDRISAMSDYGDVFEEVNRQNDFVSISIDEAFQFLTQDSVLQKWVETWGLIFVDGYFVIPDEKYVTMKNGRLSLTAYAKKNLPKCVLNIQERRRVSYKYHQDDLGLYTLLYRLDANEVAGSVLAFSPRMQSVTAFRMTDSDIDDAYTAIKKSRDDEFDGEMLSRAGDGRISLCQCLWFAIEQRGLKNPLTFHEKTKVHENYCGEIKNDKMNNITRDTLMPICIGLGLKLRVTEKLFNKAGLALRDSQEPDKTYIWIMENFPCIDINNFNALLEKFSLPPLGSKTREIHSHKQQKKSPTHQVKTSPF